MTSDPLDDLFHAAALLAYVTVARTCQGWPDSEAVRQEAYRLYEQALREKNAAKQPAAAPA